MWVWATRGTVNSTRVSVKLRAGDKQHFVFQWKDPRPFYDVHAQRFDKDMAAGEKAVEKNAREHQLAKKQQKRVRSGDPTATLTPYQTAAIMDAPYVTKGFVCKPKGMHHALDCIWIGTLLCIDGGWADSKHRSKTSPSRGA